MARTVKEKEKFDITRLRFILLGLFVGLMTGTVVSAFRYCIEVGLRAKSSGVRLFARNTVCLVALSVVNRL